MEAYRDQYATLFNNGRKVTVIGISADADTLLANWARESAFPVLFASDADGVVGQKYGAWVEKSKVNNRHLFVIGPDGRVEYVARPFKILVQDAYTELAAVVDRLAPLPADSSGGTH